MRLQRGKSPLKRRTNPNEGPHPRARPGTGPSFSQLGWGRLPDNALLFSDIEGNPLAPNAISTRFGEFATNIGMPEISFHSLRHTHASQLIASGIDIVTVSKRLGHAKPDITLRVYAHMFKDGDAKAAAAINAAFSGKW